MSATALAIVFPGWPGIRNQKWFRQVAVEKRMAEQPGAQRWLRAWDSPVEGLRVMVAWEAGHGWHLSISHSSRYPTWDEIRDARYDLVPDNCTMAILLPPRGEYINVHPNCFHLHELV